MIATLAQVDTQPLISPDATWSGVMIIVIAGLILAACVVGAIGRAMRD